ncbi:hypothetical protein JL720_662 [Aureococcus anophagefferens]|nr:hypothetical protein JL720_662 [Aureococcus anophagefferens]
MPLSVKAPPPLARPWATLPRARKDEVEGRELELQVVHYKPGEVFRLHSDVGVRRNDGTFGRSWSMFVYLRGPAGGGGGTVFPRLASSDVYDGATGAVHLDCCESVDGGGVSLKPEDGSALVWRNVDDHDRRDRRALHAARRGGPGETMGEEKPGLLMNTAVGTVCGAVYGSVVSAWVAPKIGKLDGVELSQTRCRASAR